MAVVHPILDYIARSACSTLPLRSMVAVVLPLLQGLVGWLIGLRDPTSFAQTHPPGFPGGMSWHLGQCSGMP